VSLREAGWTAHATDCILVIFSLDDVTSVNRGISASGVGIRLLVLAIRRVGVEGPLNDMYWWS